MRLGDRAGRALLDLRMQSIATDDPVEHFDCPVAVGTTPHTGFLRRPTFVAASLGRFVLGGDHSLNLVSGHPVTGQFSLQLHQFTVRKVLAKLRHDRDQNACRRSDQDDHYEHIEGRFQGKDV